MEFQNLLLMALEGDIKSLEHIARWISPSAWRIEDKNLTEEEINEMIRTCDRIIIEDKTNANAFFLRALAFHYYTNDYVLAKRLYEHAINLNHVLALGRLAYLYFFGQGCEKNHETALELCRKAIDDGDSEASYIAGFIYEQKKEYPTAIVHCEQAIKLNHASAIFLRAILHLEGHGGPIDIKNAIDLLDKAVELKHLLAMSHRAELHITNQGEPSNPLTAAKLLRRALKSPHQQPHAKKLLESIITAFRTDVIYHASITFYRLNVSNHLCDFIKSHPYEFLKFLKKDKLATLSEKTEYIDLMRRIIPAKHVNKIDIPSYKIMCQFYLDDAAEKYKDNKLEEALAIYQKIPILASIPDINAKVYHGIATIIYERALKENTHYAAFELIKPYLDEGIKIKSQPCEEMYKTIVKTLVSDRDMKDMSDYELAYENFKKSIPSDKMRLETFIAKHHLRDLTYWNFTSITNVNNEKPHGTIPYTINEIHHIINNTDSSETEKINAIGHKMNSCFHFFYHVKNKVLDKNQRLQLLFEDASKLKNK